MAQIPPILIQTYLYLFQKLIQSFKIIVRMKRDNFPSLTLQNLIPILKIHLSTNKQTP